MHCLIFLPSSKILNSCKALTNLIFLEIKVGWIALAIEIKDLFAGISFVNEVSTF